MILAQEKQKVNRGEAMQVRLSPDAKELMRVFELAYSLEVGETTFSDLMRAGLKKLVVETLRENPKVRATVARKWRGNAEEVQF